MKNHLFNLLNNLKNAQQAKKSFFFFKNIKLCKKILNLLWKEGFIAGYLIQKSTFFFIKIFLNQKFNINLFYIFAHYKNSYVLSFKELYKINNSLFLLILTTTKGIFTLKECKQKKLGGKLLILIK
uniref:Ribosomal protein S8 n=1 Tax=Melosira undulata TaxID=2133757 RepID=A0A3G1PWF7_9STRA|nr:ribosomal protein S8 [Melosira undulata]AVR57570.1 ribosomal protein S8 [Melosira undulata]